MISENSVTVGKKKERNGFGWKRAPASNSSVHNSCFSFSSLEEDSFARRYVSAALRLFAGAPKRMFPQALPLPVNRLLAAHLRTQCLPYFCPSHLALPPRRPRLFIKGREADEWNGHEPTQRIIEKCAAQTTERGKWEQRDVGCVEWQQHDTNQSGYRYCKSEGEKNSLFPARDENTLLESPGKGRNRMGTSWVHVETAQSLPHAVCIWPSSSCSSALAASGPFGRAHTVFTQLC